MCIFNEDVKDVKNTKIFVGVTAAGKQLTVYANDVENSKPSLRNAMILPFPVPVAKQSNYDEAKSHLVEYNKDIVTLLDLSMYNHIFNDLDTPFQTLSLNDDEDDEDDSLSDRSAPMLEVVQVGGYSCSVARTIKDLQRIDEKVFKVTPRILELLQKDYASGYGFVICLFTKGADSSHPIAYEHLLADGTGGGQKGALFVPCKHDHGVGKQKLKAYFDHWIYSMNCKKMEMTNVASTPRVLSTSPLNAALLPVKLAEQTVLCKSVLYGNYPNTDFNLVLC